MKLWLSTVAFDFGKENRSLTLLWHARSISLWFSLIESIPGIEVTRVGKEIGVSMWMKGRDESEKGGVERMFII